MRAILLLVLPLFLIAGPARADLEQVERRLKAVGIDPVLQAEIHVAIERAVAFLRRRQRPDGGFGATGARALGRASLCAFALRHAGTPQAMEGVARARAYLFPEGRQTYAPLLGDVYGAGLALLFLHADRRYAETHAERHVKRLLFALAEAQDEKTGWWHYKTPAFRSTRPMLEEHLINLSTSQFAVLGLWAGQRFVRERPTPVWRRHLQSLLDLAAPDGSWPYDAIPTDRGVTSRQGPISYPTGTYMGLANLVLAEAALGADDPIMKKTRAERHEVRARALQALRRHAPWTLAGYDALSFPFYSLYALEKACVFLGLERIGDIPWYREGATRLVRFQGEDGGWNARTWRRGVPEPSDASDVEGSAFALLFLLRTSETLRPVTPSEVDHVDAVITGEDETPTAAPAAPAPPDPRVPLTEAKARLERLRVLVGDRRAGDEDLLAALEAVAQAYARLAPAPGLERLFEALADRWRAEAETVLLDALALPRREPVVRAAASVLADTNPRVSGRIREIVLGVHVKGRSPVTPETLGACFDALADLDEPASATWLVDTFLDTDQREERAARTELLLRALVRFRNLPGAVRHDVVERILRAFEGVERAASVVVYGASPGTKPSGVGWPTFFYWQRVRYDAGRAAQVLARDPDTGEIPRDERGMPIVEMVPLRDWWGHHDDLRRSPWR